MDNIILLILGLMVCVMGVVNIMGNISTIHSYNRKKVREVDVPAYGKAVGTGTLIIGISLLIDFLLVALSRDELTAFVIVPAFIIGLAFILYAQFKYNKGLF